MKITYDQLFNVSACSTGLQVFEQLFGTEAELTLDNLKLFEETCGIRLYAEMCVLFKVISKEAKDNYCTGGKCRNCPIDSGTVESRFNALMEALNIESQNKK